MSDTTTDIEARDRAARLIDPKTWARYDGLIEAWSPPEGSNETPAEFAARVCAKGMADSRRMADAIIAPLIAQRAALVEAGKRVIAEKRPAYHDCIDQGEPKCAWCELDALLTSIQAGDAK